MLSNNIDFIVKRDTENLEIKINFNENESVQFLTKKTEQVKGKTYGNYIKDAVSSGGCTDVQPINGVYQKRFIKNLFKEKSISNLNDQLKYLKGHEEEKYVKVFVLDIKDSNCSYNSLKDIQAAEKEVEDFFAGKEPKEKSPRKDIYRLLKDHDINYFFCEGRLKHHLINEIFTPQQAAFFQQSDDGRAILCQISEILLDAFKLGHEISVCGEKEHIISPENYLILFKNKEKLDTEKNVVSISQITLFTLYPAHYKDLYSIKEKYCDSLSHAFKIEHDYDNETKTTAIKLSK